MLPATVQRLKRLGESRARAHIRSAPYFHKHRLPLNHTTREIRTGIALRAPAPEGLLQKQPLAPCLTAGLSLGRTLPDTLLLLQRAQPFVSKHSIQHVTRKPRQIPLDKLARRCIRKTPLAQRRVPFLLRGRPDRPPLQQLRERPARLIAPAFQCKKQCTQLHAMHRTPVCRAQSLAHKSRALLLRHHKIQIPQCAVHRRLERFARPLRCRRKHRARLVRLAECKMPPRQLTPRGGALRRVLKHPMPERNRLAHVFRSAEFHRARPELRARSVRKKSLHHRGRNEFWAQPQRLGKRRREKLHIFRRALPLIQPCSEPRERSALKRHPDERLPVRAVRQISRGILLRKRKRRLTSAGKIQRPERLRRSARCRRRPVRDPFFKCRATRAPCDLCEAAQRTETQLSFAPRPPICFLQAARCAPPSPRPTAAFRRIQSLSHRRRVFHHALERTARLGEVSGGKLQFAKF